MPDPDKRQRTRREPDPHATPTLDETATAQACYRAGPPLAAIAFAGTIVAANALTTRYELIDLEPPRTVRWHPRRVGRLGP
jgi:hypothetical protein